MRSSFAIGFGVSMLSTVVALAATDASAAYTRSFSPISCRTVASGTTAVSSTINSNGQLANRTTSRLTELCPLVSDHQGGPAGGWFAGNSASVHVYGWTTGRYGLQGTVCRTYFTGWGGVCGDWGPTSGSLVGSVIDITLIPGSALSSGDARDGYYVMMELDPGAALFSYTFVHT